MEVVTYLEDSYSIQISYKKLQKQPIIDDSRITGIGVTIGEKNSSFHSAYASVSVNSFDNALVSTFSKIGKQISVKQSKLISNFNLDIDSIDTDLKKLHCKLEVLKAFFDKKLGENSYLKEIILNVNIKNCKVFNVKGTIDSIRDISKKKIFWGLSIEFSCGFKGFIKERSIAGIGLPNQTLIENFANNLEFDKIDTLQKVQEGSYTCFFSKQAASILFHETYGHILERTNFDRLHLNPGSENLKINVCNHPKNQEFIGNYSYDDNGNLAKDILLIKDGLFNNLTIDPSNGCMRRQDFRYKAFPRMSNLLVSLPILAKDHLEYDIKITKASEGFLDVKNKSVNLFVQESTLKKGITSYHLEPFILSVSLDTFFNNIKGAYGKKEVFHAYCDSYSGVLPVSTVAQEVIVNQCHIAPLKTN